MQLETYISDLLYRYECVTVPDFGSFLTQNASASIDDSSNTFFAPKKIMSFNEQIQNNDGLLANYIATAEEIPFETANKIIAQRVKIFKAFLKQGDTINFNNIGDITLNSEGKLQFEPSYKINYLTESFGLSQFVSSKIDREIYKEEVEEIEKVIPIAVTNEKRKALPFLKYASIALIALTFGSYIASNHYSAKVEAHNQIAQEEATKQLDTKIQQATFNLNSLPAITLNVDKTENETGNFHIVAGAFRVEANGITKVKELKALGYTNAKTIGLNEYGLHQVVYGTYKTGKEALTAVKSIRENHNKEAWILVKELK
ncbi:HU domain-containing protein [Neotamlana laminarinivorans]|uniref:SPOR domain-containing protein n=1 Tax=Neotamlana laminarinivorans TaxID=2883124 RepID=A0A9X1I1P6_9FLAO|nr:SPOR domain-containing protein [Tamlana laminarinivorans]MCB4798369.1 SPOR domain-containing protein [Tamlana laminarinivorans]